MSINAKAAETTILARDEEVEIVEFFQIVALLERGRTLDGMYSSYSRFASVINDEQGLMEYDFVVRLVGTGILSINAVIKRVGISSLLRVQIVACNIRVHLHKVVKHSVYYYAGITPAYAGITPPDGAK